MEGAAEFGVATAAVEEVAGASERAVAGDVAAGNARVVRAGVRTLINGSRNAQHNAATQTACR